MREQVTEILTALFILFFNEIKFLDWFHIILILMVKLKTAFNIFMFLDKFPIIHLRIVSLRCL
jgi:hypothetical protein